MFTLVSLKAFFFFFFRDETHKVDVINFAQSKAAQCFKNENLIDKESASLLWDFIVLLCRQNGVCLTAGVFIYPKVFCTQIVFVQKSEICVLVIDLGICHRLKECVSWALTLSCSEVLMFTYCC